MFHTSKEIAGARFDDQTKLVRFQKWNMPDMGSINKKFQIMKEILKNKLNCQTILVSKYPPTGNFWGAA